MKSIVNKDNDLISRYLKIRQELIEEYKKTTCEDEEFRKYFLSKFVEKDGSVDSLLFEYDRSIIKSKLTEKSYNLIDENYLELVDNDFIAYEHRYGHVSFKTKEERTEWLIKKSDDDYDAFKFFDCIELKEIKGTIENNYNDFINKIENGYVIFIKSDSLFSDNLICNFIEE